MSKEQEVGVGMSDGKKKTKLSKKAAGGGVAAVVMKRKGDGASGLKWKSKGGGGNGAAADDVEVVEAGSQKRNRKLRKKGVRVPTVAEVIEEGSDGPEEERKLLSYSRKMKVLFSWGFLLIAEVQSRFDPANDGASPVQFVDALKRTVFTPVSQDDKNKTFIMFTFKKEGEKSGKKSIN